MPTNNGAIKFTKTSLDRIDVATASSFKDQSAFTFMCWVKVGANSTSPNQRAYLERQGSGGGIRFALTPYITDSATGKGKLRFEFARADGTNDTNYDFTVTWDDYWHHIAFTADIGNKAWQIFFDGSLAAVGSIVGGGKDGGNNALKISNTTPLGVYIGGYTLDGTNYTYWDGKIDDIKLYSSVVSQSAINSTRNDFVSNPATESGLIEEWRLNENTGTSTVGAKNAGWTGTLRRNGSASSALWNSDRAFLGPSPVQDTTPPTQPSSATTSNIGQTTAQLNWGSSTDNIYTQYYELTIATDNTFTNPIAGYAAKNMLLAQSVKVTGLTPNTNYYARVRALDAALNSSTYKTFTMFTTLAAADTTPPTTPVMNAATNITDAAFRLNWTASTDASGIGGYYIDVTTDYQFSSFETTYRNLSVGNVTTYLVNTAIKPKTKYYARVRAYDAYGNVSGNSNVVTITTDAAPDTTPPDIVLPQDASLIGSTRFTANWNVGTDNVGVVGYYLDVATDVAFTSKLVNYNNIAVGNVTQWDVVGLSPNTGYYFRVRAVDAAGNISADGAGQYVLTAPSTLAEDGVYYVDQWTAADTYVNQAASTTNFGTATSLSVSNTTSNIKKAYLQFDLSGYIGKIVNANLRLYVTAPSASTITAQLVTGTFNDATLTYSNNTLVASGGTVDFVPNVTNNFYSVDLGSILVNGAAVYTIQLSTTANLTFTFDSKEGSNPPVLQLEINPGDLTEVQTNTVAGVNVNYENLLLNPSAEAGGPSFGGATGITAISTATISQDATWFLHGTKAVKVVTTASGQGVSFASKPGLAQIVASGDKLQARVALRASTGAVQVNGIIRATYTDATTTVSATSTATMGATTGPTMGMLPISVALTAGKTLASATLELTCAAAVTFWADAACLQFVPASGVGFFPGYFDGASPDSYWSTGLVNANASSSINKGAQIVATSVYVSDANGNNNVTVAFKRQTDADFITDANNSVVNNRVAKTVTATITPYMQGNELFDPSFENALLAQNWATIGSGLTFTRQSADTYDSANAASLVCDGSGGLGVGIWANQWVYANAGETFTLSVYAKSVSGGNQLMFFVRNFTPTGTLGAAQQSTVTMTTDWARYSFTFTVASTGFFRPSFVTGQSGAMSFLLDACQLERGSTATAYVDGNQPDGRWVGLPHLSPTYRALTHGGVYDVLLTYSDPDGVIGVNQVPLTVTIPRSPDNITTITNLSITAGDDFLSAEARYSGDDNGGNSVIFEYRRSDQTNWIAVNSTISRVSRVASARIGGLNPGTPYDVRATFTDTDGVYGGTLINSTSASISSTKRTTTATQQVAVTLFVSFDGFQLGGDASGSVFITEHDAHGHPERRSQVEDSPRNDGANFISDFWGRRVITIKGVVEGQTREELATNVQALRKSLAPQEKKLVIDTLDSRKRYFIATCTSLDMPEIGGETIRHLLWTAEFTCSDPFRYDSEETVEADLPFSDQTTWMIANDGDESTGARFTFAFNKLGAGSVTLINDTTGERIQPNPTFTINDVLTIDTTTLSCQKNGVEVDYVGSFPVLLPGVNAIRIHTTNSQTCSVTINRRHKYL